jgi:tape measure domain-containing protein
VSVVSNLVVNVDSSNAVSKLKQVQQGAQATQRATTDLTTAFSKLQAGATTAFSKLQAGAAGAARSLSGLRGVLASIGATAAVSKAFGDAQALMLAQKRLSRLTQEYKQFAGAQQEAERLANKFEVSVTDTAGALGSLASRLGAQGRSLNDIVAVYEGLNSALVATGRSSTEAAAASYQLSQALGSGSLTGDELKTISETLPELLNEVAKAAGVSSLQIRELAKDGKLSADLIIQATKQLRDKYSQDVEANITATQKFQNALSGLSEAVGTELAPAITELLKAGAEALKLFGKLPGPVKTLIAAAAGLTAAFVALAPAISATIGLLGGLSLATLAAAGPWIALAAGVTAAAVALAGYRSESQKVGGAARGGGAAEVTAASKLLAQKDAQIAGLQGQRQTASGRQRGSIDRNLVVLRRERDQLQSDVKAGTAATPAATAATAMGTPVGATVGGSGGRTSGGADKAANDAKRAAEAAKQEAERVQEVIRNRLAEGQIIAVKIQQQDRIAAAEAAGDKMLVARLKSAEQELDIQYRYAQELAKESNLDAQKAIVYKGLNELTANQLNLQRELDALQAQSDQDRLSSLQKYIEKQYELNKSVQNQLRLSDGVANTLGEGLGSAFNALISGAQGWEDSLRQIASGVLVDIANQLIRIFVIEQAINAIKAFLTPFSASTPLGAGGGQVGKFGTLGPNYGIPQRAKGGPVSSGQTYMVGERGPELFVPGRSGTIVANDKMGGGNTNVVVNVDAKGSSVEGDEQGANQLGRVISAAVQSELIKQQRPGGILAR